VQAVFEFEKSLKIHKSDWLPQGYIPFNKINENMRFHILEEAVKKSKIKQDDKESLRRVRNDFFHEKFESTDDERRVFDKYIPVTKDGKNKTVKS